MTSHPSPSSAQTTLTMTSIPATVMIVVGCVALFVPAIAGIALSILFGIVILLAGLAYGAMAFAARGTGAVLWRLFVAVVFSVSSVDLLTHPAMGLATLTLVVAVSFFVEGIAEIGSFFSLRSAKSSGYLLVNAGFSLLLALLIWRNWPYSSSWAIGTLIGVNLLTTGFTRLLLAPGRTAAFTY